MLSTGILKLKELTDKVTNVVMNYSDVETKVREATSDDAWGPHGSLMKEVATFTFTYEHFPEVMGMLWKRMLHENKRNWRRVYKSLVLLNYLIKNGSERVVTSTREHIYDLKGLENYSFIDEQGKDQGLNVRHKVKELLDFINDDERLREERKKAKKTKDKYVGVSSDAIGGGGGSSYSDRYDEEPQSYHTHKDKQMEEIDDWDTGKKSVVGEAIDKAKDLWNRAQGKQQPDDINGGRFDEEYNRERDYEKHREKDRDDLDRHSGTKNKDKYDIKDDDEEYTVERTHTTKTEKITTNRRTRSMGKTVGASGSLGKDGDAQSQTSSTVDSGPSLFDLSDPSENQESFADFSNFQAASVGNDESSQRARDSSSDFGDFSQFRPDANIASNGGFADFNQFSSVTVSSPASPTFSAISVSIPPSATTTTSAVNDLFDVFSTPTAPTLTPMQLNAGLMGNSMTPGTGNMGMMTGMPSGMNSMGMSTGMVMTADGMGVQGHGMNMMYTTVPMTAMPNMMHQPMMMQHPGIMNPGVVGWGSGINPNMQKSNTWADATAKVNINLDELSPRGKQKLPPQGPSLNQISGGQVQPMGYGVGMMSPGMVGVNQGMSNMTLQNSGVSPMMGGNMQMMGAPRLGMNNMGVGVGQPAMMGGMQMTMTSNISSNTNFQKRTDTAFSDFGNVKKGF
uniref:ENTH domain-containing protein n=1 Tax=Arion vulgaris TaxID=1028688 RepID=A0A0B6ZXP1_9EUPU